MTAAVNTQIRLARRPKGLLAAEDVETTHEPVPEPADGEALLAVQYVGIDATVRSWLNPAPGYLPPVQIGEVVRAASVGTVVASRCDAYAVGDVCTSLTGWQQYSIVRDDFFTTRLGTTDDFPDPKAVIALYGSTGATALFGLLDVGKPQPGDTVVVSAAAGATGSLVGQIARIHGCRTIAITSSPEKAAVCRDVFGFDETIAYRSENVAARLKELCPKGINVFFDNVGGDVLDAVLSRLAFRARVVLCGAISGYTAERRPPGPSNYIDLIQTRSTMQGYLNIDDVPRYPEAIAQLNEWHRSGQLTYVADVYEGLESSVDALNSLFLGTNTGKVMVSTGL